MAIRQTRMGFGSKWVVDYLFIPLIIFWCAFEPNFIHGPVEYLEEGQHLSVINEVFHGKMPIKDTFTFYGPLHIYLPVLAMRLFKESLGALRGYFHFGNIFSLIIVYLLGRSICRTRFFSYLLAFLLLLEAHHPFWSTRWGGIRNGLGLLVVLFLVAFIKRRKRIWLVWAGIFSAFSLLYTIEIAVFSSLSAVSAIIFVAFGRKNHRIAEAARIFLIYLTGGLLIILSFLLCLWVNHALWPYIAASFAIINKYYICHIEALRQPLPGFFVSDLTPANFMRWLFSIHFKVFTPIFVYAAVILYIFFKLIKKAMTDRLIIISVLTIYGLLLYISSFRSLLGIQFQAALPVVIILECLFLESLFLYCKGRRETIAIFSLCILSLSFVYLLCSEKKFYSSLSGWFYYQANKRSLIPVHIMPLPVSELQLAPLETKRAKGILVPTYQKEDIEGVTKYVAGNTGTNEQVFTFPEHGIFNFFADRPAVGRFPIAGFAWVNKVYQSEILRSIKEAKPRYVILGRGISELALSIGRKEELLPEISGFIKKNYILVKSFNTVDIYCLKL